MRRPERKSEIEFATVRNALLCEDVRDEIGNKKSLMGVLAGDVIVAEFPATLKVCVYAEIEFNPDRNIKRTEILLTHDDQEILRAQIEFEPSRNVVSMVLPQGLLKLDRPGTLRLAMSAGEQTITLLEKKVLKGG